MPDLIHVTNETLAHFGYPTHTDAAIHSFVGDGAQRLIYRALPEGTPDAVCAEALEYWKALYPKTGHARTRHYAHMPETLAELKARGCKLAVLSNKYEGGVKDVIPRFLPDLFEMLHGECEGIPRKPDPTGLLRTIRELGSAPERTAYVGDSARRHARCPQCRNVRNRRRLGLQSRKHPARGTGRRYHLRPHAVA